jgi:hypothetical protein
MTTATTRASGTIRVHPESASHMISSRLWIVPREARSRQSRRSSRSSYGRNAHGIQVPVMRQLIVTTSGGLSAIPAVARRTRSPWTKNPKTMTKGTKGATQSSKTLRRPSMSSSGGMETSVLGGNKNCFFGRSCPLSRRHHDHSAGRRCPSRSPMMISGQAFRSLVSYLWFWTRWWQKSGSPRCSSTVGVVSTSSSRNTLRKMGLDFMDMLVPSKSPFYGIVPGNAAHPLGTMVLLVTFSTRENYRTEFIKFEVANFESSYHAILGRPALAKFMAVLHYVYLLLLRCQDKVGYSLFDATWRSRTIATRRRSIMLRLHMCQMLLGKYSRPRSSSPKPGWRSLQERPASRASSRLVTWSSSRSSSRRVTHLIPPLLVRA